MTDTERELEKMIGENMGCYYRVATKQWLKEVNNPHTKKYSHVENMTAEVKGLTQTVLRLIHEARIDELKRLHRFQGKGLPLRDYDNETDELIDERLAELQHPKDDKQDGGSDER